MVVPLLELQEHARTLGIHSLPREAEAGASEYRDWRSREDQSIKNLLSGMGGGAFRTPIADKQRGKHEPGHLASGFCLGGSRRIAIFPAEPAMRSRYSSKWRIRFELLPGDAAGLGSPLR